MKARVIAIGVTLSALLSVLLAWWWGTPPLARLASASGHVERDTRGAEDAWFAAQVGDSLGLGDGLRTGKQSRARLSLSRGTVLQLDESTTLRLLSAAPGQESFRIIEGGAEIEAGDAELAIETPAGPVRVARKSRVALRNTAGSTWVRVDMGRAELGWSRRESLAPGQERRSAPEAVDAAPAVAARAADHPEGHEPHAEGVAAWVRGAEVRIQKRGEQASSSIAAGEHRLPLGTRVTVEADSSIELAQAEGGRLVTSGRAELVVGDGAESATRVMSGKLRATAGRVPVEVEVPGGRIVLLVDEAKAAAATLEATRDQTQVDVEQGSVALHGAETERTLAAGEQGSLRAASREVERREQTPSRASEGAAGMADAPALSDVSLPAGGALQIHDPNPPTAVAFALDDRCEGREATLEQADGSGHYTPRARGKGRLLAWFAAGSTAYRVRCAEENGALGKLVASGRVAVLRDRGERQVTRRAPEVEVDLDGRKYTAVYQTLLPRVRIHAMGAAAGKSATLRVEGSGGARTFSLAQGELTLESGQLAEGEHVLRLEGADDKQKPTRLAIHFDNATPAAYVDGAGGLTRASDGTFVLRGGALPGSEVSVDGVRVALDKESRFEAHVRLAPGAHGFGLWIKHPRAGSHYYVRRAQEGGAP